MRKLIKGQKAVNLARLRADQEKAIDVFYELYRLLEDFAPAWYSEELHERAKGALRALGRNNDGPVAFRKVS